MEVRHYYGSDALRQIEVRSFDDKGSLLERWGEDDPEKKVLIEKDTYTRNKEDDLIEEYKGFHLRDNHYIGELLWRGIEKEKGKERWEKIDNNWWTDSFREISYDRDKKWIYEYVIQKNGETFHKKHKTAVLNQRGQTITSITYECRQASGYIMTWTYNDHGHLLKEETEQIRKDGISGSTVKGPYTVQEVGDCHHPLQVSDEQGHKRVYTYRN